MDTGQKPRVWWQTIPGILTAIAAIITAVTGLILALHQIGVFIGKEGQVDRSHSPQEMGDSQRSPKQLSTGYFFDDFSAPTLGGEWMVLQGDNKKWWLEADNQKLVIKTQKGSLSESDKNLRNQFILNHKLPDADYEVIVKGVIQILSQHNSMSIALFQDDDNFLELGYSGEVGPINRSYIMRVPHFVMEIEGQPNSILGKKPRWHPADAPETIYLKIERIGNQYSGYYSFVESDTPVNIENVRWTKIGTQAGIFHNAKLSIWAENGNKNVITGGLPKEVEVRFDFVMIRETGR